MSVSATVSINGDTKPGNHVVFIHQEGGSPSHYAFARLIDKGLDGRLNWDLMDQAGVYLGHSSDQLVATDSSGGVTHATGAKVYAQSLGKDSSNLPITSLDGSNKTILEAARDAGKVTALVQSGSIVEPGTAAFVAKTDSIINPDGSITVPRAQQAEIAKQVINSGVDFIFAGGEISLLPVGTNGFHGTAAQLDVISTNSRTRPSENLITRAQDLGYTVVYTKDQLNSLLALPILPTKVLGVFAAVHTFNDRPEEVLTQQNLPLYQPTAPTIAEMLAVTQKLIEAHPNFSKGSIAIVEEEGADNFSNNNNARGTLEAVRRADAAIGVAMEFSGRHPNTLVFTAAESNAGGLQIIDRTGAAVGIVNNNPTTNNRNVPLDGATGANTAPFQSAADTNGNQFTFGVAWTSTQDFSASTVAKAHGLNADKLPATLDNTKIYELMYETLFGVELTSRQPDLIAQAPAASKAMGNVIFIHPDGTSPASFMALRNIDKGPDGRLNWDRMPEAGINLAQSTNQIVASGNAGAVTHATGVKVFGESFGLKEDNTALVAASRKTGVTILDEAIAAGKATALVQSGHLAEPGTAAFAAKIKNRDGDNQRADGKFAEIAEQVIRSGAQVILAGGEVYLLPQGTLGFHVDAAIDAQYSNPLHRPSTNLVELAKSLGYTVVYTKTQLATAVSEATAATKLLGLFAADHTYDARREEQLGLNTGAPLPLYKESAPTVAEMLTAALAIVSKDPDGFFVAVEEEGSGKFSNNNNAIGAVEATRRADAAIGVAMNFVDSQDPNTLVLTASDNDAGGMQVFQFSPFNRPSGNSTSFPALSDAEPSAPFARINPTTTNTNQAVLDGTKGSTGNVADPWTPFKSVDSLDGPMGNFAIGWAGIPDFAGGTVAKAYGMNADRLPSTLDNTEIYKLMYETLFGVDLDVVISIAAADADLAEGNSGSTTYSFTVTRSGDTSAASSASWTVAGTGINPAEASDFIDGTFPNGTVSFAAGETSQTILVNVAGDTTFEQDETFAVTLSAPSGAILDPASSIASGTIRNDDPEQTSATYQISGTAVVGQTLTAIRTAPDPQGDGTPAFSWQTFSAGSWTPVGTASTYLISAADEGKPLRLLVSYTDGTGFAETITVEAGTVPLMPALSITALTPSQNEGSIGTTSFVFEISRSGDLTGSTSVAWSVDGSGTNPATNTDFALNQLPSGTAVFAAGQANLTLTIAVVGDGSVESDERFQVVLGSASNGRITSGGASATSLILNDDLASQTYAFTASSSIVYEGNPLNIGVATTNVSAGTRLYWQASGTNITDSDFTSGGLSGEVVIGSDGRASFTRTVAADPLVDPDEVMELKFYSDASRSQQVGTTLSITIKEPSVSVITDGNDIITGTAAGEMITGIPVGSSLRGRGSRDELTGGGGDDIFALGDQSGVYYDDGLSGNRGTLDMAIIRDFASGDRIQLWGDASKYSLVSALFGGVRGVRIDLNPTMLGALGEAIGFVQAATPTSLSLGNSSQFLYLV